VTIAVHTSQPAPFVPRNAGHVRRFDAGDIPQVVDLHRRVWPGNPRPLAEYREYFRRVFLENPSWHTSLSSLVYEEADGRITGFVGIVPRRIVLHGQRFLAAVSSQFIVDPSAHVGLVAVRLAKSFLDGPQDVSIADEANDVSRKVWEGLGGSTALFLSLYWTRLLRPARFALSFLRERRNLAPLATASRPVATLADAIATRVPGSPFRPIERSAATLCTRTIVAHAAELCDTSSLRAEHDERTLRWLLGRAATRNGGGELLTGMVYAGKALAGWYIAHLDQVGIADVAQLRAAPSAVQDVLDHLFSEAWRRGALAVTGRMDARFMEALSDRHSVFHRRGPWTLIKTRHPEILQSFQSGEACFSRLDGEWSLRF
jgi:hypothetical protein